MKHASCLTVSPSQYFSLSLSLSDIHTHTHTYTNMRAHPHTYTHKHIVTHIHRFTHIHTHSHTFTRIHTHIHTCKHKHTHTCIIYPPSSLGLSPITLQLSSQPAFMWLIPSAFVFPPQQRAYVCDSFYSTLHRSSPSLPSLPSLRVFPLISSFWAVLSGSITSSPYNVRHPVTVRQGLNQRPCSRVHWPVSAMLSSFGLYPAENHLPPRGMAPFSCWADSLSG